jgi:3-oxoacyl-[acyl-carrier-protein] synthase-3
MTNAIITGTGSYIPDKEIPNDYFLGHDFYGADGIKLERSNVEIINKLKEITCISKRRYINDKLNTSDMAFLAAEQALDGKDREDLDCIIVAQNFGDVISGSTRANMVPTIAARVKHKLKIENPYTVAFDIPFGCPGWLQGMILSDYFIKSGDAKKILVIGAETLSRVSDAYDIDSMIYADGAGATLIEATDKDAGILSHVTRSDTLEDAYLLWAGRTYNLQDDGNELFIKMNGHKIYKYAVRTVPEVVMKSLKRAGIALTEKYSVGINYESRFGLNELSTKSIAVIAPLNFPVFV